MSEFIQRHIGPSKNEQAEMLTDLELTSVDELVRQIVPDSILLRNYINYQKVVMSKRHLRN